MTLSLYLLNAGLLAFVLLSNLGVRPVTRRRFTVPIVLVAIAAAVFLQDIPTHGGDLGLQVAGAVTGVLLGLVAAACVRVERDPSGRLVMRAGIAYAALWIAVIGGRMMFAYGADHWFPRAVAEFSMAHRITGAQAWTTAFILLSLCMVVTRVVTTALVVGRTNRRSADLPAPSAALA